MYFNLIYNVLLMYFSFVLFIYLNIGCVFLFKELFLVLFYFRFISYFGFVVYLGRFEGRRIRLDVLMIIDKVFRFEEFF